MDVGKKEPLKSTDKSFEAITNSMQTFGEMNGRDLSLIESTTTETLIYMKTVTENVKETIPKPLEKNRVSVSSPSLEVAESVANVVERLETEQEEDINEESDSAEEMDFDQAQSIEEKSLSQALESRSLEREIIEEEQADLKEMLASQSTHVKVIETTKTRERTRDFTRHTTISTFFDRKKIQPEDVEELNRQLHILFRSLQQVPEKQRPDAIKDYVKTIKIQKIEPDGTQHPLTEPEFEEFAEELQKILLDYYYESIAPTKEKEEVKKEAKHKEEKTVTREEYKVSYVSVTRHEDTHKKGSFIHEIEILCMLIIKNAVTESMRTKRKEEENRAVIAQHQWIIMQDVLKYEQKQSSIKETIVKAANTVADVGKSILKKLFSPIHTVLSGKKATV